MKTNNKAKVDYKGFIVGSTVAAIALTLLPELAMAADNKDGFLEIYNKMNGWVGGSAGKLLTFSSLVMAAVMGVAGFPAKFIIGAIALGLMLGSADTLVDMIFTTTTTKS